MGAEKSRGHGPGHPVSSLGKATAQDNQVMATNNSSIVSKRSVERLYYKNEPHFFRFFVNKFQRRAPLINRGYHLRLHVIDITLRNFLSQLSPRRKVIVNLGCGSDVIPWQCWTRYPDSCDKSGAIFVDVDFPDLIQRKRDIVLKTPELLSHLIDVDTTQSDTNILLHSRKYIQIGCDLRQISALEKALASIVDLQNCLFIFIAEVSITYMEREAADSLINWAGSLDQAEFCLLEQLLPDNASHPFAKTMLDHFEKLSTPIKSVSAYPTIKHQYVRFRDRGWGTVRAQSLWSAWNHESFVTPDHRRKLDLIEPFDEWEEFGLFASHYLILHASNHSDDIVADEPIGNICQVPVANSTIAFRKISGQHALRRFGAATARSDVFGEEAIFNCMGMGNTTRFPSYDIYTREESLYEMETKPSQGPSSRMCFTFTDLGEYGALLAGGRSSPAKAMSDCWLFKKNSQTWERTHNLPIPLYRHSTCRLMGTSLVLLMGGRSKATGVSDLISVYHPGNGWLRCSVEGPTLPEPSFGSILVCSGSLRKPGQDPVFSGFIAGGMLNNGLMNKTVMAWSLLCKQKAPFITFFPADVLGQETNRLLSRFGSLHVQDHSSLIVLGGVGSDGLITREDDIAAFTISGSRIKAVNRILIPDSARGIDIPRPLIVGSSAVLTKDGDIIIIGGAATCFSMGTYWTKGTYTLSLPGTGIDSTDGSISPGLRGWQLSHSGEFLQMPAEKKSSCQSDSENIVEYTPIKRVAVDSRETFERVITDGVPVVLTGLDQGVCHEKWTLKYLVKMVGETHKVVVHESSVLNMDFKAKNFRYTTMTFGDFARGIQNGRRLYLRSLSADAPTEIAASLDKDFPALGADFSLPEALATCRDNMHSSVLRISGPVNMWLHYDVQANVYCQIAGRKRMLLFPPSDVSHLSFAPGASSSSIDVFGSIDSNSPILKGTHPWEANLSPRDILWIPPLWSHTATPSTDLSVAVNVFYRSLEPGAYATGRDVYGNRDLAAYEKGRQDISKIANAFSKVPSDARHFYMARLVDELSVKSRS